MIPIYDLCVIGGGVNGAGIARDAAGRGLKVLLVDKSDLAAATSSASTKLIHGGLRYLEYYEFGLVRDSLKEREVLMGIAPHIIRPLNFILPHEAGQRPRWMIAAGLFLYDHLAKRRRLPKSQRVKFSGGALKDSYKNGFAYSDCRVDDSRLVVLNALDAAENGAHVLTRADCIAMRAEEGRWRITLKGSDGRNLEVEAAMAVNATGPWAAKFLARMGFENDDAPGVRLVKGSHIIVNRAFAGNDAYLLQQPDKRIVFAIPYQDDFTLIGTTEESYGGDPEDPAISEAEIEYLLGAFNRSFKHQLAKGDVIWTYSGVRPLLDDGADEARKVTRDYKLHTHEHLGAPLLSVFGGKLTTYRVLAEKAVNIILGQLGKMVDPWTADEPLPGGDMPHGDVSLFLAKKTAQYDMLLPPLIEHYASAYGTRMDRFLEGARSLKDLGAHFGGGLYEAEVFYLARNEWAMTAEDILWRRTKAGLRADDKTVAALEAALPGIIKKAAA